VTATKLAPSRSSTVLQNPAGCNGICDYSRLSPNGVNRGTRRLTVSAYLSIRHVKNYEAGLKSQWLDNRLRVNVTGYHMNWNDIQFTTLVPASCSSSAATRQGHDNGGEFDISFRPMSIGPWDSTVPTSMPSDAVVLSGVLRLVHCDLACAVGHAACFRAQGEGLAPGTLRLRVEFERSGTRTAQHVVRGPLMEHDVPRDARSAAELFADEPQAGRGLGHWLPICHRQCLRQACRSVINRSDYDFYQAINMAARRLPDR